MRTVIPPLFTQEDLQHLLTLALTSPDSSPPGSHQPEPPPPEPPPPEPAAAATDPWDEPW